jgi:hypothetical protein
MPDNNTQKELLEAKKRQQELIEIKKLREQGGSLPNNIEHEVLQTPKDKLHHFWYYYKYYVISFVIILGVFAALVAQCATRTQYDYTILVNGNKYIVDADLDSIKAEITKLADDRNGDGKVEVLIINCSRPSNYNNPQFNNTQVTKFQTQLIENDAKIFIIDEEVFEQFNTEELKLWTKEFNLPDKNGAAIDLKNTSLSKYFEGYESNIYMAFRISDDYNGKDAELFRKILYILEK